MNDPVRLMFVDDEAEILRGLRNVLRRQRGSWDMVFACGGDEALQLLAERRFDIVVSDMRMPGMDGVELLTNVKARHPHITRIILSGDAEAGAMLRSLSVAHQFLSKPCESDVLVSTLHRAIELRRLFADEQLRRVVGSLKGVPMLAMQHARLTALLARPDIGAAELGREVEASAATTTKLFQIVSATMPSAERPIESAEEAITLLGIEFVRGVLLTTSIFDLIDGERGADLEPLQAACVAAAADARRGAVAAKNASRVDWAALLQEAGWFVLAHAYPQHCAEIMAQPPERRAALETEILGASHADVGAYVLGLWGLPLAAVESVRTHIGACRSDTCICNRALNVAPAPDVRTHA